MSKPQIPTILEAADVEHLSKTQADALMFAYRQGDHMVEPAHAVLREYLERTPPHARAAITAFISLYLALPDQLRLAHQLLKWAKEDEAKA